MNHQIAKYFLYYPSTLLRGEFVALYLKRYREFQWLPAEQISVYQTAQLSRLLRTVTATNEFYRELYAGLGPLPEHLDSLEELKRFPTISKQDLIAQGTRITSNKGLFASSKTTGGSTGEPVKLFKSPSALARERAATWRAYEWAGVRIGDPQGRFWGVPHSRTGRIKAQITDTLSNRRRLSAFNITRETLKAYYAQLSAFRPAYLYGYVSSIERLAEYILDERPAPIPSIRSVITTAEVLSASARSNIEKAFGVKVFNEYGCGEVGSIAHECEHGNLHLMADNLIVEIDSDGHSPGEIIVTDLYNLATPLIRYRLGDFAAFADAPCACGRSLPVIASVHGRAYDLIKLPSGRMIHPEAVIYIFEAIQQRTALFRQFQAIQTAIDHMLIKLVPTQEIRSEHLDVLAAQLKKNISESMKYSFEICETLEREKSGKMRVVKSMLNQK